MTQEGRHLAKVQFHFIRRYGMKPVHDSLLEVLVATAKLLMGSSFAVKECSSAAVS